MPYIIPKYPNVTWPINEGTIGVVGVAPWATLDFCKKVYEQKKATKDWEYPRLIIDANSKIPSRGRHLELGERDPSPFITTTINELASAGATVAVVPCNTAHILFDRWGAAAAIPVINIVNASVKQLCKGRPIKATVLGSSHLIQSNIYKQAIESGKFTYINVDEKGQILINQLIAHLKCTPCLTPELESKLYTLVQRLFSSEINVIILACTELGLISKHPVWEGIRVVDSNEALAIESLKTI